MSLKAMGVDLFFAGVMIGLWSKREGPRLLGVWVVLVGVMMMVGPP